LRKDWNWQVYILTRFGKQYLWNHGNFSLKCRKCDIPKRKSGFLRGRTRGVVFNPALVQCRTPDYPYRGLFSRRLILSGQNLAVLSQFCPDFELASKFFANLSRLAK
jgi:hypothetical protein